MSKMEPCSRCARESDKLVSGTLQAVSTMGKRELQNIKLCPRCIQEVREAWKPAHAKP